MGRESMGRRVTICARRKGDSVPQDVFRRRGVDRYVLPEEREVAAVPNPRGDARANALGHKLARMLRLEPGGTLHGEACFRLGRPWDDMFYHDGLWRLVEQFVLANRGEEGRF